MAYGHTIAAISTPPGKGGVALIRISGEDALAVAERVFTPKRRGAAIKDNPRAQLYGDIRNSAEFVDDGMLTYFPAPHSYTGEDVVEISCHGGTLVTRCVLEAVLSAGATAAEAGEFTRRAFINGRLTLTEAEAIGTVLEARSRDQLRISSAPSRDILAEKIAEIREELTSLLSSIFARIDYPDEDLGEFTARESLVILTEIDGKINRLLSTYPTGKAICEGIRTVIAGKPNVGKSTLYNAVLGEDAAIVTSVAGTTRDVLSREVSLGKVMLHLSDTAGVRDIALADEVEGIGIERTRAELNKAELIIAVFDASRPLDGEDAALVAELGALGAAKIAVLNKCDLDAVITPESLGGSFDAVISTSAKDSPTDTAAALAREAERLFTDGSIRVGEEAVIYSARQNSALMRAHVFIGAAIAAYERGEWEDAAASEIERALGAIAEADGRAVSDEVVAGIFSKFCVGK